MAEVAAHANYGLAAGVWTNDIKKAHKMVALLKSGVVWVNTQIKTTWINLR